MKLLKAMALGSLTGFALMASGCLTAPVMPPPGILFTSYEAPLDYDQQSSPVGSRSGEAGTISILGLVAVGDGSIEAAAEEGGITTVTGADYKYFNILGIYQSYTTVVHGE